MQNQTTSPPKREGLSNIFQFTHYVVSQKLIIIAKVNLTKLLKFMQIRSDEHRAKARGKKTPQLRKVPHHTRSVLGAEGS